MDGLTGQKLIRGSRSDASLARGGRAGARMSRNRVMGAVAFTIPFVRGSCADPGTIRYRTPLPAVSGGEAGEAVTGTERMEDRMAALRRYALIVILILSGILPLGCGGGEKPSAPAGESAAASTETAAVEAAGTASASEASAEEEGSPEAGVTEYRILVIGADGHRRNEVVDVLADVANEVRATGYRDVTDETKQTLSWVTGDRRITLVDYVDLDALQAGIGEGPWSGALFISDPARSPGNRDDFLDAARRAGITKLVLFQVVSDLLTDMEVYDLEKQIWPDELGKKGFETDGMAMLQADVSKAASGDGTQRRAFVDLIEQIEANLAK